MCRFLVFLAGGGWISGEDGGGGVAGEDAFPLAGTTMTGEDVCSGASRAVVAVPPRCRRQRPRRWWRLPAAAAVSAGTGRLQDTVMAWHPAAWLMTRQAFRRLAKQRSYSAENSAAVTTGPGQVFFSTRAQCFTTGHARPHRGAQGGMRAGRRRGRQLAPSRPGSLACDPKEGEAGWRGA